MKTKFLSLYNNLHAWQFVYSHTDAFYFIVCLCLSSWFINRDQLLKTSIAQSRKN